MERGHVKSAKPGCRVLSRDELAAIDYINWVRKALGGHNEMVAYISNMLVLEIEETPLQEAAGKLQRLPGDASEFRPSA